MIRPFALVLGLLLSGPVLAGQPAVRALPMETMGMPDGASAPAAPINGTLRIGKISGGGFQKLVDLDGVAGRADLAVRAFPAMEIALVTDGSDLIPRVRGIRVTDHSFWDLIVEPGRVWLGEAGETFLSLPFALMEKNANCLHNGMLLAVIGRDGSQGSAHLQVASETCLYFKFNLWAGADATWTAGTGDDTAVVRWRQEKAARLPARPSDPALAQADLILPGDMTVYGAVRDGRHERGGCDTRFGAYPYCDVMPVPSYSFAKTLVGGVGLMRLEAEVPGVRERFVADLIPGCSSYTGVTLDHLLDMTTGHYIEEATEADEAATAYLPFFTAATAAEKTRFACTRFPKRQAPGRHVSYHTSDTWLLGVAMQAVWRHHTGREDSDFYTDLIVPLWKELGLSALADSTRRLDGMPFTGYGLVLQAGDVAKLAHLLAARDPRLARALPTVEGLPAGDKSLRYKGGFWFWDAGPSFGCRRPAWLPFLSGYGGLSAVLLPKGDVYYYVSDSGVHRFKGPVTMLADKSHICGGAGS